MENEMASAKQISYIKVLSFQRKQHLSPKPLGQLTKKEAFLVIKKALEPSTEEVSSSSQETGDSPVSPSSSEEDKPYTDSENPMDYRLTFYTRAKKGGRLKVYTYYWKSAEHDQEIYKVRTNYIEFLTYKFKDAPHFCNGVLQHREKAVKVYDTSKEKLVTRFTPVTLRKSNPYTKKENFELDYNFFSEKARKNSSRIIEMDS